MRPHEMKNAAKAQSATNELLFSVGLRQTANILPCRNEFKGLRSAVTISEQQFAKLNRGLCLRVDVKNLRELQIIKHELNLTDNRFVVQDFVVQIKVRR